MISNEHNISVKNALQSYKTKINDFIQEKTIELETQLLDTNKLISSDRLYILGKYLSSISCKVYNINEIELGKKRCSPIASEIIDMCIIMLRDLTTYTNKEIIKTFGKKGESRMNHALSRHNNKNVKIKHERVYLENYEIIISEFKKYLKAESL